MKLGPFGKVSSSGTKPIKHKVVCGRENRENNRVYDVVFRFRGRDIRVADHSHFFAISRVCCHHHLAAVTAAALPLSAELAKLDCACALETDQSACASHDQTEITEKRSNKILLLQLLISTTKILTIISVC